MESDGPHLVVQQVKRSLTSTSSCQLKKAWQKLQAATTEDSKFSLAKSVLEMNDICS